MRAPFPSSLTAAPRGGAVAWVFDAGGRRNFWVADPARGEKAHAITACGEDDGFHVDDLAWSPDLKSSAFTRGGSLEEDLPANVSSAPAGPQPREVWVTASAGGGAHRVGGGAPPRAFRPTTRTWCSLIRS